ncbi:hypothetical protein E1B28_006218 [Marasmius oreades]|uniref:Uncharacterized protein n=1 Tax=Marasmius oreades TaxID=181124 RepID=A0A9P7UWC4_9AGAR|nr:uncharacterized protein E1B28_006218 [Marasmius oreades]KAG7095479.1 hypothetical protein E1B28_006218 [Marasmius oreades]
MKPYSVATLLLLELPLLSLGFTWKFNQTPSQCGQLTISIDGQGKPPYSVLILPSGSTPFPNGTEVRKILEAKSSGNSAEITFQLNYPANSQFVAAVSDSSGFGSGGTSAAAQVTESNDSSCFDPTQPVSPVWVFNLNPPSQIVQCQDTRIWWDPSKVQGEVSFLGVIPGGQSFQIPRGALTTVASQGLGFTWKPNLRSGTILHIVASDDRGTGSGGSTRPTVGDNIQNDNSCLNNSSPSSTAGNPAGGSYPTDSQGNGVHGGGNSDGGSHTNVGAIVGGVIGGVFGLIALVLVLLFFRKRSRGRRSNEKPVDLLNADEGDESHRSELPQYYEPEPFLIPDPTVVGSDRSSDGRPLSGNYSERPSSRSGTPDVTSTSTGTRKVPPRQFKAVNVIQHDDAGPSEQKPPGVEESETIELPPAYTNIRQ